MYNLDNVIAFYLQIAYRSVSNILEKKTLFLNDIKLTDEDSDNEQCDFID